MRIPLTVLIVAAVWALVPLAAPVDTAAFTNEATRPLVAVENTPQNVQLAYLIVSATEALIFTGGAFVCWRLRGLAFEVSPTRVGIARTDKVLSKGVHRRK